MRRINNELGTVVLLLGSFGSVCVAILPAVFDYTALIDEPTDADPQPAELRGLQTFFADIRASSTSGAPGQLSVACVQREQALLLPKQRTRLRAIRDLIQEIASVRDVRLDAVDELGALGASPNRYCSPDLTQRMGMARGA